MSSFCPFGPVKRSPASSDDVYFQPLGRPIVYPCCPWCVVCATALPAPPSPGVRRAAGRVAAPCRWRRGGFLARARGRGGGAVGVGAALVVLPGLGAGVLSATVRPPPGPWAPLPSSSSPPRVRASTVPITASTTTSAMTTSVRRGTTSVIEARGTGRAGRSGGAITGQPELRPPVDALAPRAPSAPRAAPAVPAAGLAVVAERGVDRVAAAGSVSGVRAAAPDAEADGVPPDLVRAAPAAPAATAPCARNAARRAASPRPPRPAWPRRPAYRAARAAARPGWRPPAGRRRRAR